MIEWWTPLHDASLIVILAAVGTMLAVRFGRFDNKENK